MQIMIDIPDEDMPKRQDMLTVDFVFIDGHISQCDYPFKELPKGHGDLIDRRELKKEVYTTTEWNGDVHRIIYEASIDDAPTIIEADKTEDLDNLDLMLEHLWNATVEDHRKYSEDMESEDKG